MAEPACFVCSHLLSTPAQSFLVQHTPRSTRPALLCTTQCAPSEEEAQVVTREAWREVSLSAWQQVLREGEWEETSGRPSRLASAAAHVTEPRACLPLPDTSREQLLDATFITDTLFVLLDAGKGGKILRRFALSTSSTASLETLSSLRLDTLIADEASFWRHEEEDAKEERLRCLLHVSPCKSYLCVAQRFGSLAALIELSTPRLVRMLDRGAYHEDVSEFPAAFAEHDGETVLVAGSDWNRVDVYRAQDGALLTAREFLPANEDEPNARPEHALDYFYGALTISPTGTWVVSSGWCWHPVGVVSCWNLARWLEQDPFESEDGKTRRVPDSLVDDLWDRTMTFIDEDRLLVWGIFHDSFLHSPGLMIYDIAQGAVLDLISFEGVQCRGLVCVDGAALILDELGDVWRVNLATHRVEAHHRGPGAFRLLSRGVALCTSEGRDVLELALLGPLP